MISPHSYSIHTLGQSTNLTSKVLILFQNRKSITIASLYKCFLPKLQLANREKSSLIYTQEGRMASSRRAHQVVSKGLPSVESGLPLLSHYYHMSNQIQTEEEGATSFLHGLPPQEGATSPRGAHLLSHMCSNPKRYGINQLPIKCILSPLTS
jgi:hypothetical protein